MVQSDQSHLSSFKRRWFGTDGIRACYGKEPMTLDFIRRCGWAAAQYFSHLRNSQNALMSGIKAKSNSDKPVLLIGRDTRSSGLILEEAFVQGLTEGGALAKKLGVLPTAALSFLIKHHQAAAGVMISASHNPATDNGIKFFGPDGFKLTDQAEFEIEKLIDQAPSFGFHSATQHQSFSDLSYFASIPAEIEIFYEQLLSCFPRSLNLKGFRIVADLAHGAAWTTTPELLKRLGAEVILVGNTPTGENINEACGATHIECVQAAMLRYPSNGVATIGLAHDGDADRLILVDEKGHVLNGDVILAIVGRSYLQSGRLNQKTLVATQMSNLALEEALAPYGGKVIRTDVGDRYVLDAMRQHDLNVGGEQSGHFIFLDHLPSGDGLLSALNVFSIMAESQKRLHELAAAYKPYPQKLVNLNVSHKPPLESLDDLQKTIRQVQEKLSSQGRILLRYSGTESKLRLLIESKDPTLIEPAIQTIVASIEQSICIESNK